ncbi:helix-turn-helix domain-containing protein [Actinomadura kijaniata]|uniref:helix-turn-helix domain-containing protein n=1 Tax=Actinomadura kijaniata TaxID=46161 RepID=UPI00082D1668|nr:helix-turn-helix domain-containing protein [Actinomadura kijaniata]
MAQQYYSVEQVAELLDLHVRTVRGYVRDGRLRATRIGKQYRIAREDLEEFTGAPAPAAPSAETYAEASTVVRVDGIGRDAANRVANTVAALLNGPGAHGLHVQTVHDEPRSALKVVVVGGLEGTAEILKVVHALTEGPS